MAPATEQTLLTCFACDSHIAGAEALSLVDREVSCPKCCRRYVVREEHGRLGYWLWPDPVPMPAPSP